MFKSEMHQFKFYIEKFKPDLNRFKFTHREFKSKLNPTIQPGRDQAGSLPSAPLRLPWRAKRTRAWARSSSSAVPLPASLANR